MSFGYANNQNILLLIALLKKKQIKKVIASPGMTDMEMVVSLQSDPYFEMYSCVDERSAAYMACGLAEESGEPVVIICTESTASREYYPGLTEAFHRKLPILAITGLHDYNYIGQLEPQVIDRSVSPPDTFCLKVHLPVIRSEADREESQFLINEALLALTRHGGGPVHIDLPWDSQFDFSVQTLPQVRSIERITYEDPFPELGEKKIAIYVGSHRPWTEAETTAIDQFCAAHDAVVFCDHASKYYGKYRVQATLLAAQRMKFEVLQNIDLLIHVGEETGDTTMISELREAVKEVWRVSPDGELRDTFHKLTYVFEMREQHFFEAYTTPVSAPKTAYYEACQNALTYVRSQIPELPFSNIYAASKIAPMLPKNAVIHFGPSDTIRAWSFFELPPSVRSGVNAGCRGIDGAVSSCIGASFAKPDTIFFCVVGDLTFFYDMNSLGNRCLKNNLRILLINNDGGNIFRHKNHPLQTKVGFEEGNLYAAAGGHFGAKSPTLVKDYAENLGFEYLCASNKEEFEAAYPQFITPVMTEKPILFEMFTDSAEDASAFDLMQNVTTTSKQQVKEFAKNIIGDKNVARLKKMMKS